MKVTQTTTLGENGDQTKKAFQLLKEKLYSPSILAYANFYKSFILHKDASFNSMCAVLYQDHDDQKKGIAYVTSTCSRGLKISEKNNPPYKREFLSLKKKVTEKFHNYLYGNSLAVITDNNPLRYILTSAKLDATEYILKICFDWMNQ